MIGAPPWLALTSLSLLAYLCHGQSTVFYRPISTERVALELLSQPGLIRWVSPGPAVPFALQTAAAVDGPWHSDFSYTVVSVVDRELVALVPTHPFTMPEIDILDTNLTAQIRSSTAVAGFPCQIETYVWRNVMPGPDPVPGVFASIGVVGTTEAGLPEETVITRAWVIKGSESWNAVSPPRVFPQETNEIRVIMRDGPAWPVGATVDVLAHVTVGQIHYLLRATNETVHLVSQR